VAIGPLYCRLRFLRRFRIVVRRSLYFERTIYKLGPTYLNCPANCSGPKADRKHGCPKCEYQIQRKAWISDVERELKDTATEPHENEDWPLAYLIDTINTISVAANQKWRARQFTVVTAKLVSIYRDEISKMRASDSWTADQRLEALKKRKSGQYYGDDEVE